MDPYELGVAMAVARLAERRRRAERRRVAPRIPPDRMSRWVPRSRIAMGSPSNTARP